MTRLKKSKFLEPISSTIPKRTSGDRGRFVDSSVNKTITMMCPAQGFPVPSYRSGLLKI